jgi:hypothetical protein
MCVLAIIWLHITGFVAWNRRSVTSKFPELFITLPVVLHETWFCRNLDLTRFKEHSLRFRHCKVLFLSKLLQKYSYLSSKNGFGFFRSWDPSWRDEIWERQRGSEKNAIELLKVIPKGLLYKCLQRWQYGWHECVAAERDGSVTLISQCVSIR